MSGRKEGTPQRIVPYVKNIEGQQKLVIESIDLRAIRPQVPDEEMPFADLSLSDLEVMRKNLRVQRRVKEGAYQRLSSSTVNGSFIDVTKGRDYVLSALKEQAERAAPINIAENEYLDVVGQISSVEAEIQKRNKEKFEEEKRRREAVKRQNSNTNVQTGVHMNGKAHVEPSARMNNPSDVKEVSANDLCINLLGQELYDEIQAIRVFEETDVLKKRIPLPGGRSLDVGIIREQEIPDKIGDPEPPVLWKGYVHLNRRKEECGKDGEPELKAPLARLGEYVSDSRGYKLSLLTDDEIEELIHDNAKLIGKRNQDLRGDLRLLIDSFRSPDLRGFHKLNGRENKRRIEGKDMTLFRFSPAEVQPKLNFQNKSEAERARIVFLFDKPNGQTLQTRVLVDLIPHDVFDERYSFGVASHR